MRTESPKPHDNRLWVDNMYSAATGSGVVHVTQGEHSQVWTPEESEDIAIDLLKAGAATIADAFIIEFLTDYLGPDIQMDDVQRGVILNRIREFRARKTNEKSRSR